MQLLMEGLFCCPLSTLVPLLASITLTGDLLQGAARLHMCAAKQVLA